MTHSLEDGVLDKIRSCYQPSWPSSAVSASKTPVTDSLSPSLAELPPVVSHVKISDGTY